MNNTILRKLTGLTLLLSFVVSAVVLTGCDEEGGYSTEPLFTDEISTVYVKMFDNMSFERGIEYELSDALAKRIEAETPYKVVSSIDRADSVISGSITRADRGILSVERETARPLEKEIALIATVNWKNLKTGRYLVESRNATAAASWSEWQNQGIAYGSSLAANKLAERIVELMEKPWQ
jgi:hypothetical protein